MTIAEIMTGIQQRLDQRPERTAGVNACWQFDLSGEGAENFYVDVRNGKATVLSGNHASPGVTIQMSAPDFVSMIKGELSGMNAFMTGRLKIKGDMGLAMKLQSILGN